MKYITQTESMDSMKSDVRTRYAPSPTGYMHIGNLRTALYEYLIAKRSNGTFILRIEDTDRERNVEGAEDAIYRTLKLAGIEYDEGPDKDGGYGPYIQSHRKHLYKEYAQKLVNLGEAYYCFCSRERLAGLREKYDKAGVESKYDRHCLSLAKNEIDSKLSAGEPYVIRQKMPDSGTTSFEDSVYGTITVENSTLDDQILLKSDGLPTYNFANVVDDHLMRITHVVRGNEYLSSAPKYNLLYKAFGWDVPVYVHVPLIIKPDGRKLSKREGDPTFEDLVDMGYLVETIINFVVLLGWSPGTTQEIFSLKELEQVFDIGGINKAPAVFDMNKLNWMNGEYIRRMSPDDFHRLALPYYQHLNNQAGLDLKRISSLLQVRTEVLGTIPENTAFFGSLPEYDINLFVHAKMKTTPQNSLENLKAAHDRLSRLNEWNEQLIHDALFALIQEMAVKNGQMLWPVRVALSGRESSPGGAVEIAAIIGKDETLRRMELAIKKLKEASF